LFLGIHVIEFSSTNNRGYKNNNYKDCVLEQSNHETWKR